MTKLFKRIPWFFKSARKRLPVILLGIWAPFFGLSADDLQARAEAAFQAQERLEKF